MRILLIEDDPEASRYISRGLREAGHVVALADNGPDGLSMASDEEHDVLIVDRMLPSMDGLSIIETLRSQNSPLPILILSALGDLEDRVLGLRAGGDDYLPKPFAFEELLARVEALGRRPGPGSLTTSLWLLILRWTCLRERCNEPISRLLCNPGNSGFSNTSCATVVRS